MKIQFKNLSLALIALGLSGVASAAMYAPPAPAICTGHNVVVPCEGMGWRVGITGLHVEQTSDTPYAIGVDSSIFTGTGGTLDRHFFNLDEDYNWGFKLEAAYIWRQGHELALSWKRVHGSSDDIHVVSPIVTITPLPGLTVTTPTLDIFTPYDTDLAAVLIPSPLGGGVAPTSSVTSHASFDFDQVNGEIAQYVHFGDFVNTRFNFGLSYLKLDHDIDTALAGSITVDTSTLDVSSSYVAAVSDESRFDGIGIRTGLNANWNLFRSDALSFGIIGEANAGLYAGDLKNTVNAIVSSTTTLTPVEIAPATFTATGAFRSHYEDDRTIVPEAEAKLGLGLGYMMGNVGRLELNGGWETQGVFHAIKHLGAVSNYGHQGPYLQLQYVA